jgi:hypothetical protein
VAGSPTGAFQPRVKGATTSRSPNITTLLDQLGDGTIFIPDYQRDSSEWDSAKKSLFVDSLINNMTIPPLILYPETNSETGVEKSEVVDGQQRLATIRDFFRGDFALATEDEPEYASNVGPVIQGKRFAELPEPIQRSIRYYVLNLIVLPTNLDLGLRLEIFRRINEAGTPLSAHDLRLAIFGQCDRVYFIRLAGVFDREREGAMRMIKAAKEKYGLDHPWKDPSAWKDWWIDSAQAAGQAPSQMFLYYLIARDVAKVDELLASEALQNRLGLRYDRTTISVLDLYAAQMQHETLHPEEAPKALPSLQTIREWFESFELWFNTIKQQKVPRIGTNSSTKIALFIAAATQVWKTPEKINEKQWELVQIFLTQGPSAIERDIGLAYPIAKGKWPGQKKQILATGEICQLIARR